MCCPGPWASHPESSGVLRTPPPPPGPPMLVLCGHQGLPLSLCSSRTHSWCTRVPAIYPGPRFHICFSKEIHRGNYSPFNAQQVGPSPTGPLPGSLLWVLRSTAED